MWGYYRDSMMQNEMRKSGRRVRVSIASWCILRSFLYPRNTRKPLKDFRDSMT